MSEAKKDWEVTLSYTKKHDDTYLRKEQVVTESYLNKAKKEFEWTEDYKPFTYKEYEVK